MENQMGVADRDGISACQGQHPTLAFWGVKEEFYQLTEEDLLKTGAVIWLKSLRTLPCRGEAAFSFSESSGEDASSLF